MATYEYFCEKCNHSWEEEASVHDPASTHCPECKQESAKRLISCSGHFILKGGGWADEGYK